VAQPVYMTVAEIKAILQGAGQYELPVTLTDARIASYIKSRSREIDSALPNYAQFPDIALTPADGPPKVYGTPELIKQVCLGLVEADCLHFLGLDIHGESGRNLTREAAMKNILTALAAGTMMLPPDEYNYAQTDGANARESVDPNKPKPVYGTRLTRDDTL